MGILKFRKPGAERRMRRGRLIRPTYGRLVGPIRHADCRQRKLADFLCTGGIIQGLISVAHQAIPLRAAHFRFSIPTSPG
ncbi:hypothetical protein FRA39_29055 [Escherichia coli]|nr:hypothetical protein FRA39_29055 [Escherichia coli]